MDRLATALLADQVATHPLVIEELALGSIANRSAFLDSLGRLRRTAGVSHAEVRELVEGRRWWGRGLSAVDVQLMASVLVTPGSLLWTRDRRLRAVAAENRVRLVSWN